MSALCPLPSDLAPRLGARTALQPLTPFPAPRLHTAPWHLTRQPKAWASTSRLAWRPDLELPEDVLAALSPPEKEDLRLARELRARAVPPSPCPHYETWTLAVKDNAIPAATWSVISTTALPAPCRVESLRITTGEIGLPQATKCALQLSGSPLSARQANLTGEDLTRYNSSVVGFVPDTADQSPGFPLMLAGGSPDGWPNDLHIGKAIEQSGQYLTFGVWNAGVVANAWHVLAWVTILLCGPGAAITEPGSFRSISAPTRRPAAAAPPPAPPPAPGLPAVPRPRWMPPGVSATRPQLLPSVTTAASATAIAAYMTSVGAHTQAAEYRDMAARMSRGLALTATQRTYLLDPAAYGPVPLTTMSQALPGIPRFGF